MKCFTCGKPLPKGVDPLADITHPFCSEHCAYSATGLFLATPSKETNQTTDGYPMSESLKAKADVGGRPLDPQQLVDIVKEVSKPKDHDPVNHPSHYTSHPSGVECITITRHMTFNIGNVIKYVWRSGLKGEAPAVQDLKKAAFYLNDEIKRIEEQQATCPPTT